MTTKTQPSSILLTLAAQLQQLIPVETIAAWGESLKKAYEQAAEISHKRVIEWHEWDLKRITEGRSRDGWHDPKQPSNRYLVGKPREYNYGGTRLENAQAALDYAKTLTLNLDLAHKDAEAELISSQEAFSHRGAKKLFESGLTEIATIEGSLRYIGGINAAITLTTKDGKQANLVCKGKTNYRYGSNSANGYMTVYNQYPFKVTLY